MGLPLPPPFLDLIPGAQELADSLRLHPEATQGRQVCCVPHTPPHLAFSTASPRGGQGVPDPGGGWTELRHAGQRPFLGWLRARGRWGRGARDLLLDSCLKGRPATIIQCLECFPHPWWWAVLSLGDCELNKMAVGEVRS